MATRADNRKAILKNRKRPGETDAQRLARLKANKRRNWGGRRTAGKHTDETSRALSLRQRFAIMPLDYLLGVLNNAKESKRMRFEAAKAAAPFVHPRLAAIQVTAKRRYALDVTKLTEDELAMLERIMLKAQISEGAQSPEEIMREAIDAEYQILPPGASLEDGEADGNGNGNENGAR